MYHNGDADAASALVSSSPASASSSSSTLAFNARARARFKGERAMDAIYATATDERRENRRSNNKLRRRAQLGFHDGSPQSSERTRRAMRTITHSRGMAWRGGGRGRPIIGSP